MRKISILCFALLFLIGSTVSANNEERTGNNDALLLELGYDQSDIENFKKSDVKLMKTMNNKDITGKELRKYAQLGYSKKEIENFGGNDIAYLNNLEGELVAVDKKYMKDDPNSGMIEITKEEYDQSVEQYMQLMAVCNTSTSTCSDSETSPNWMVLTTAVSRISGTSPQEYLIKHDFSWTAKPFYQFKDAVGVAHHISMTPIQDSEYLKYTSNAYYSTNPIVGLGPWTADGTNEKWFWTANDKTGGMAFEFQVTPDWKQLANGKQYKYENHRGTVAYRAIRNNSSFTSADISGHYIHTEQSFSGSLGVSVTGTGSFSISASVTKTAALQTGVSFNY